MSRAIAPERVSILHLSGAENHPYDFESLFAAVHCPRIERVSCATLKDAVERLHECAFDLVILSGFGKAERLGQEVRALKSAAPEAPLLVILPPEWEFSASSAPVGVDDVLQEIHLNPPLLERTLRLLLGPASGARVLMNERLASVGLLASGMAHEIGTPLGVIRGRAEVLLMKNRDDDALKRNLGIIIEQVDRISKLMKSLLNLARGDDAKLAGVIDLREVVNEVVGIMGATFRLHGVPLVNEMAAGARVRAVGDPEPLHQILCNLFQNSLHAIEQARRSGNPGPHEIRVTLSDAGDLWRLAVSDTGCGIQPEEKARLFRPFYSTKGIGGGVGLGLALSHRIIQSWKGTIDCESQPGKGASFQITLPKETSVAD